MADAQAPSRAATAATSTPIIAAPTPRRVRRGETWRRLARNELTVAGAIILAVVMSAAIFAP